MNLYKPTVFVSSTIWDLPSERKAAETAILKVGSLPGMSEKTFIAENKNSLRVCIDHVKRSDIYVLILGGRYGFALDNGKSITETEWDTARDLNKPRLVFNLRYQEKEQKQTEFATNVGQVYHGRFWKEVDDAFQLAEEIEKALRALFNEERGKERANKEKIYSSLIGLTFPDELWQASLSIDRNAVIEASKSSERSLSKKADSRSVIFEALRQKGLRFSADWMTFKGQIISFHNLSDKNLPLSQVVDLGTTECLTPGEFYSDDDDYKNIFKGLLRHSLRQKLYRLRIEWVHDDELFRFMAIDDQMRVRKESWQTSKMSTRKVFELIKEDWKGKTYQHCKHLAFKVSFVDMDGKWYLSVIPDWSMTWDGKKRDFREADRISWLKRNERNQHVFNHLKFLYHYLKKWDNDLYSERYQFLRFGGILSVESYPRLEDHTWLRNEEKKVANKLIDGSGQIPMEL